MIKVTPILASLVISKSAVLKDLWMSLVLESDSQWTSVKSEKLLVKLYKMFGY